MQAGLGPSLTPILGVPAISPGTLKFCSPTSGELPWQPLSLSRPQDFLASNIRSLELPELRPLDPPSARPEPQPLTRCPAPPPVESSASQDFLASSIRSLELPELRPLDPPSARPEPQPLTGGPAPPPAESSASLLMLETGYTGPHPSSHSEFRPAQSGAPADTP